MKAAIITNLIMLICLLEINAVAPNFNGQYRMAVVLKRERHSIRIAKRCGITKWNYRNKIINGKRIEKIIKQFKHLKNNGK